MKFEPFQLERWLSECRLRCEIDLSSSVITHFKYSELISQEDLNMPVRIGPTNGHEVLRQKISELYQGAVDEDSVLVTHGASEANFLLLNYLIAPRDECILVVPNYMQVWGILRAIGARVKLAYLDENRDYKLDIDGINELISKNTKAILVTNPNNPTGAVLTSDELRGICDLAKVVHAYVIGDEVLSGLEIDGKRSLSPVEIYDRGISTRSLSKLGLSGLRVGWVAARDPAVAKGCWRIRDYTSLGSSFFNQHIAVVALRSLDKIAQRDREILSERVGTLMNWVKENEEFVICVRPKAGATAMVKYKFGIDSTEFCTQLLKEERVAVSPGDYFVVPESFRVLYGTDQSKLKAALERIHKFLERVQKERS